MIENQTMRQGSCYSQRKEPDIRWIYLWQESYWPVLALSGCWQTGASGKSILRNDGKQELSRMIVLGMIVLLLGGYLLYALVHPERF